MSMVSNLLAMASVRGTCGMHVMYISWIHFMPKTSRRIEPRASGGDQIFLMSAIGQVCHVLHFCILKVLYFLFDCQAKSFKSCNYRVITFFFLVVEIITLCKTCHVDLLGTSEKDWLFQRLFACRYSEKSNLRRCFGPRFSFLKLFKKVRAVKLLRLVSLVRS